MVAIKENKAVDVDPWEVFILDYLKDKTEVVVGELLFVLPDEWGAKTTPGSRERATKIMEKIGWQYGRKPNRVAQGRGTIGFFKAPKGWGAGDSGADVLVVPFDARLDQLRQVSALQSMPGTFDYDPYMHGMANGLILALHVMTQAPGDAPFKDAPVKWRRDDAASKIPETVKG